LFSSSGNHLSLATGYHLIVTDPSPFCYNKVKNAVIWWKMFTFGRLCRLEWGVRQCRRSVSPTVIRSINKRIFALGRVSPAFSGVIKSKS